jgi:hypothetical protein
MLIQRKARKMQSYRLDDVTISRLNELSVKTNLSMSNLIEMATTVIYYAEDKYFEQWKAILKDADEAVYPRYVD